MQIDRLPLLLSASRLALGPCFAIFALRLGAEGFAGSCDWRLPTAVELAGRDSEGTATGGIVDLTVAGCVDDGTVGSGAPCINAIFGPTASSYYWSSSTEAPGTPYYPAYVSGVYFSGGFVGGGYKPTSWVVRAVRSGP